jgi:hypothetical protein
MKSCSVVHTVQIGWNSTSLLVLRERNLKYGTCSPDAWRRCHGNTALTIDMEAGYCSSDDDFGNFGGFWQHPDVAYERVGVAGVECDRVGPIDAHHRTHTIVATPYNNTLILCYLMM